MTDGQTNKQIFLVDCVVIRGVEIGPLCEWQKYTYQKRRQHEGMIYKSGYERIIHISENNWVGGGIFTYDLRL